MEKTGLLTPTAEQEAAAQTELVRFFNEFNANPANGQQQWTALFHNQQRCQQRLREHLELLKDVKIFLRATTKEKEVVGLPKRQQTTASSFAANLLGRCEALVLRAQDEDAGDGDGDGSGSEGEGDDGGEGEDGEGGEEGEGSEVDSEQDQGAVTIIPALGGTLLSQCCHTVATLLPHCCHTVVQVLLHRRLTMMASAGAGEGQAWLTSVQGDLVAEQVQTLLSHCCHTVVTTFSHFCYAFVTLLVRCCYTVVPLLFHVSRGS
jgi:hypothetical protein